MDGAIFLTQMKTHLETALGLLTERERSIVKLRYFDDLTSEEIAVLTDITAGNVRVILTRALKKLAKYFENNGIRWE
jgi:RNA polymerase sigma factor (sigma-70 family)